MGNFVIRFFKESDFDAICNTIRWNSVRRIQNESLTDHLFMCSLFATLLIEDLLIGNDNYLIDFKLKVTRAAMMHDFDEIFTGDILHHFKHNDFNGDEVNAALKNFLKHKLSQTFSKNVNSESVIIDSIHYYNDESVKDFVKVTDWLSCMYFMLKEKDMGNKHFDEFFPKLRISLIESIKKCKISMSYQFNKDLDWSALNEIIEFVNEELKIYGN